MHLFFIQKVIILLWNGGKKFFLIKRSSFLKSLGESRLKISCLLLGCLVNKPCLHCKPQMSQCFGLLCFWQREPGSDKSPIKEKSKTPVRFLPQLSMLCGWQDSGPPVGCQAWASEVEELSSGHWTTRDLLAPHNINRQQLSQRSPSQCEDIAPLNDQQAPVLDTPYQKTSKTGTQPHPLAERLPKIILSSQTPQNTPLDVVLPTRKTRSSLIHQNTGTSPLHQEANRSHWTNLTHWGKTSKTTGTTNLQPAKRRTQTQ